MASNESKAMGEEARLQREHRKHVLSQVSVRIMGCGSAAVAAILMAFNRETASIGDINMQADFKTVSAFKFFLGGNAVVSAYCLLSLPFMVAKQGKNSFMHMLDLLTMGLAAAAAASASAVGYVGKYGNESAGWMPVCGYFPSYCNRVLLSIGFSFLGFLGCFLFCLGQPTRKQPRGGGGGGGDGATNA